MSFTTVFVIRNFDHSVYNIICISGYRTSRTAVVVRRWGRVFCCSEFFRPKLLSRKISIQTCRVIQPHSMPIMENNELTNFQGKTFGLSGFQFFAKLNNAQKSSFPPSLVRFIHEIFYYIRQKPLYFTYFDLERPKQCLKNM